jgi:ribosomal protein S18 acetylase RimI-like enzyme
LVAESDVGSVGVVRFDCKKTDVLAYDVSITIAPQHRGKGFGANVLADACSYMGDYTLDAEVRKDNTASRRLFEQCGFEEVSRSSTFLNYRREPLG